MMREGPGACSPRMINTGKFSAPYADSGVGFEQGLEIQRPLWRPSNQRFLCGRAHRIPRARAVPVIYEVGGSVAIFAGYDAATDATRKAGDLSVRRGSAFIQLPEKVEGRRLIKNHTGNAVRTVQCHVQCNAAAIGVADKMNRLCTFLDQRDRAGGFIPKRKGVLARPRALAFAAEVLWRQHLALTDQRFGEVAPLAGIGAGTVQGDYARKT